MKVIGIAGSLRRDSHNKKVLRAALAMAKEAGAEVREIDLKEAALPVYDGDIEAEGMPASVEAVRTAIQEVDVLLIATPEYNRSVPGGLKNAIDWASRHPNMLNGKVAGIVGASPSRLGTLSSQSHLRFILNHLNVLVTPNPEVYLGEISDESFTEDGSFADEKTSGYVKTLVGNTLELASKLQ